MIYIVCFSTGAPIRAFRKYEEAEAYKEKITCNDNFFMILTCEFEG